MTAILGCDPAHFQRYPVYDSHATAPLEEALRAFEREDLSPDLFLTDPPESLAAHYRERGFEVLRWYDRDANPSSPRGSFYYLAVLMKSESRQIELVSAAFPAFGESPGLERLRRQLSKELCARDFVVEGECGG
jgi:hypothetical protein